ncbi:phage portal protein [Streptomyces shenzhenensis]|uniref:phage portal protein n=1 Tax=Streptomyces shenzhenensis TaxID=943815 RepID=UPI003827C6D0
MWLDRGETGLGDVTEMHLVFDQVDVIVDKPLAQRPTTANVIGFRIRRADGTQVPVLPEEMLWLRYPHPWDPLGCLAPWKAARHAVDMDAFAREWQRQSYKNGARPTGVVYLGDMNETEFKQVKAAWRSSMQGPENAGKNLLVRSTPGSGEDHPVVGHDRPEAGDHRQRDRSTQAARRPAHAKPVNEPSRARQPHRTSGANHAGRAR